jgi:RHS repeat-associated protein
VTTSYVYDAASRLSSLQQDIAGTANDPNFTFTYNAAGQAVSRTGNAAYAWPQPSISAVSYAPNGRNQYASVGGTSFTYDARGNLTSTGAAGYGYDAFNRLTSAGSATLAYDPAGRLYQTTNSGGSVTARFLYDGVDAIAEYNGSNVLQRRYVHGPGFDEPIVEYLGSGTSDRRWLVTDQLGSVVAVTNASGASIATNTYDEYGQPGASNSGRFQYTGQMWIGEAGLYHYKARAYSPTLGRFLQTDPILYAGGMNLYRCVRNDPVNLVDPLGLEADDGVIIITGVRPGGQDELGQRSRGPATPGANMSPNSEIVLEDIVVVGKRKPKQRQNPCADIPPAVLDYLSSVGMNSARILNWEAQRTGRNFEVGGAIGIGSQGQLVTNTTYGNPRRPGSVDLSSARRSLGVTARWDWHTHVDAGVNGAEFGFSWWVDGGDVPSTATTPEGFEGSFLVLSDQVRYLSRDAAIAAMRGGVPMHLAGVRCR